VQVDRDSKDLKASLETLVLLETLGKLALLGLWATQADKVRLVSPVLEVPSGHPAILVLPASLELLVRKDELDLMEIQVPWDSLVLLGTEDLMEELAHVVTQDHRDLKVSSLSINIIIFLAY